MTETRGELAPSLVFVMRFLSGASRTSGEREAIARCCPKEGIGSKLACRRILFVSGLCGASRAADDCETIIRWART